MGRNVKIEPYFGIGNQLFQYMMALALQQRAGIQVEITGFNIPSFGLVGPPNGPPQGFRVDVQNHIVPLAALTELLSLCPHIDINIKSLSCRMVYYEPLLELYRVSLLSKMPSDNPGFDSQYLVINIRAGDIISGIHPHYMPLPFSFYRQIISETCLIPVFMGQVNSKDDYCAALRKEFPNANFLQSYSPLEDFCVLSKSENIVLSISTFAWLAGWLSISAKRIYLPVAGLYDPLSRPDIDLLPINDRRYMFYDLQLPSWTGTREALSSIVSDNRAFKHISSETLVNRFGDLLNREGLHVYRPPLT